MTTGTDRADDVEPEGSEASNEEDTDDGSMGAWIAIGLPLGVALGVALDDVAIGVALGLVLGAGMGAIDSNR